MSTSTEQTWPRELPLHQVVITDHNPRRRHDADKQRELAESVAEIGVLEPILVRPRGTTGGFELVAGERRLRAAIAAKLETIPVVVRQLDDHQAALVRLVENIAREDLVPIDEAEGYRQLVETHGYAVEDVARKAGKSERYVYDRIALCKLPARVKKLLEREVLGVTHALMISRIPDKEKQFEAACMIAGLSPDGTVGVEDPLSVAEARLAIMQEYMTRLADAPWDLTDVTLLPEAGACSACPKRTSVQHDLWGKHAERDDTCTDARCFKLKRSTHNDRVIARAREEGINVLEGKDARKALLHVDGYGAGKYVRPDATNHSFPAGRTTYEAALGKRALKKVERVLAYDEARGEPVELLDRKACIEELKSRPWGKKAFAPRKTATRTPATKYDANIEYEIARRALAEIVAAFDSAGAGINTMSMWKVLCITVAEIHGGHDVIKRRGFKVGKGPEAVRRPAAQLADVLAPTALNTAPLAGLIFEMLLSDDVYSGDTGAMVPVAELVGVDLDKIRAEVKEEEKTTTTKKKATKKKKEKTP